MPFRIITMPFDPENEMFSEELLNQFCLNKRISFYQIEFFQAYGKPYWSVFLEYEVVLEKTTEGETNGLNDEEKLLFEKLRQWRKERADAEGVPVYIIATNNELKDIIRLSPKSLDALKSVKGFGRKKIEKYGNDILTIIRAFFEKS